MKSLCVNKVLSEWLVVDCPEFSVGISCLAFLFFTGNKTEVWGRLTVCVVVEFDGMIVFKLCGGSERKKFE